MATNMRTHPQGMFPPPEARPRAVLVDNISPLATPDALADFFSFCGTIEEHRLRQVGGLQQAVVIFSDERARENALVMNQSSIVDTEVTITTIPDSFNFYDDPTTTAAGVQQGQGFGLFGASLPGFGDFFQGAAAQVERASNALSQATDSGVLKSAKSQMGLVRKRTMDFANDLDSKWQVRENVKNVAEASTKHATAVASAVASSTSTLASQVDQNLQISQNTNMIAQRARQNQAVDSGIRAVQAGFNNLLAQTGLQAENNTATSTANGSNPQAQSVTPQTEVADDGAQAADGSAIKT